MREQRGTAASLHGVNLSTGQKLLALPVWSSPKCLLNIARGVVAASHRSDRQLELASTGYTVNSEAADKLFISSMISAPASSVTPIGRCLDSQDTRQQGARAGTHHSRTP